jgi:hypothetical protein
MPETFRAKIYKNDGSGAEFPEGIANRYEIDYDDSVRVILNRVVRSNGSVVE